MGPSGGKDEKIRYKHHGLRSHGSSEDLRTKTAMGAPTSEPLRSPLPMRIAASSPGATMMAPPTFGGFPGPQVQVPSEGLQRYGAQTVVPQGFGAGTQTALPRPPTGKYDDRALRAFPTAHVETPGWTASAYATARPLPRQMNKPEPMKTAMLQPAVYGNRMETWSAKTARPQSLAQPTCSGYETAIPQPPQMGIVEKGVAQTCSNNAMDDYFHLRTAQSPMTSRSPTSPAAIRSPAALAPQKVKKVTADRAKTKEKVDIIAKAAWQEVIKKVFHYQLDRSDEDISFSEASKVIKASPLESGSKVVKSASSRTDSRKKKRDDRSKEKGDDGSKFQSHVLRVGINGLIEEFKTLPIKVTPEEIRAFSENPKKNRYKNVPCLDCTRVKLKGNNEYIHANYVQSASNPKRFICTQGPLSATANDFWLMIAQEKVESIIMLCNVVEEGVRKCDEYFPTSEHNKKIYDDISIELIKAVDTASADSKWIVISDIKMQWSGESRKIRHYRWLDWPDRGVPPSGVTPFRLYHEVKRTKTPIVIHCSAGVGRTGTIVALFIILDHIENGEACPHAVDVVTKLRQQRHSAIQKPNQYLYLNRILFDHFERRRRSSSKERDRNAQLQKFTADYEEFLEKNP